MIRKTLFALAAALMSVGTFSSTVAVMNAGAGSASSPVA